MGWAGHIARMEKGRIAFIILIGIPTGRTKRKWEDNIIMVLKK